MESLGAVSVEYLHLFHCEEMAYFLDHDSAKFRNIVEASRPLAKWNCAVRNRVFQYLQRLEFRHSYSYYRSYQAYRTARASQAQGRAKTAVHDDVSFADRSLRIDTFESDLRAVEHSARRLVTCDDFAVKISEPQIQLIENDAADYFVLLSTPQIDVSVVSVNDGSKLDDVGSRPLATRFGSVLKDTDIFLIDRSIDPKGPGADGDGAAVRPHEQSRRRRSTQRADVQHGPARDAARLGAGARPVLARRDAAAVLRAAVQGAERRGPGIGHGGRLQRPGRRVRASCRRVAQAGVLARAVAAAQPAAGRAVHADAFSGERRRAAGRRAGVGSTGGEDQDGHGGGKPAVSAAGDRARHVQQDRAGQRGHDKQGVGRHATGKKHGRGLFPAATLGRRIDAHV
ncbi:hypothetical protein KL941_004647 [Ogataea angusta]|nr:hypothetical protein KL941_004647 [Ogataea angusta]